ncbi:MAG: cytochrome c [Candidatus Acidiferrum sp.]
MVHPVVRTLVMSCTLALLFGGFDHAQEKQTEKAPSNSSRAPTGAELYNKHCAVCHGTDLKGAGPFPPPYRTPPDLTTLANRHGGKFPAAYVSNVLKNGVRLPAHGPAEMPVWGSDFEARDRLEKIQVKARIKELTDYIKSLQQK